jgi:hypothetical protein
MNNPYLHPDRIWLMEVIEANELCGAVLSHCIEDEVGDPQAVSAACEAYKNAVHATRAMDELLRKTPTAFYRKSRIRSEIVDIKYLITQRTELLGVATDEIDLSYTYAEPTVADDAATIEASLRRLKALHDDGILTDDEYKKKRQALADQL